MSEFQVGDRVSVEGVVVVKTDRTLHITIDNRSGQTVIVPSDRDVGLTLVERPRRKLRVGSVWERINEHRYVAVGLDRLAYVPTVMSLTPPAPEHRSTLGFDSNPELWREVPVEELAREAQGCDDCQSLTCQCDGTDAW